MGDHGLGFNHGELLVGRYLLFSGLVLVWKFIENFPSNSRLSNFPCFKEPFEENTSQN
uniref:Uncharacterized protein n=1 Tax=Rhizophora mucronata TaxID=61149 RepID=A0A2P2MFU6_RHIMU